MSIPSPKNSNLQEKRHFQQPRKVSTIMKKPQLLHLKNSQSLQKSLTPSEKFSTPLNQPQELPTWENLNSTPPETI